jgi:hypothetical protein
MAYDESYAEPVEVNDIDESDDVTVDFEPVDFADNDFVFLLPEDNDLVNDTADSVDDCDDYDSDSPYDDDTDTENVPSGEDSTDLQTLVTTSTTTGTPADASDAATLIALLEDDVTEVINTTGFINVTDDIVLQMDKVINNTMWLIFRGDITGGYTITIRVT